MRGILVTAAWLLLAAALGVAQEGGSASPGQPSQDPQPQTVPSQANPQNSPPQNSQQPNAGAQGSQEPKAKEAPNAPSHTKSEKEIEAQKEEQSYRVMGVVPMFGTTSRHNATALTRKEKLHLFSRSAFDPITFVVVGMQAGISQAQDSFPSYGQGAEGYGKRYGAAFADSVDSNFFSNFFYPVLFKQDPRYFRLGEGTVKHRIVYSVEQEFVAHTDKGGRMFHFSNVLGALTAGSISNAYYPQSDRGFGLTMSRAGIALLYGALGGAFSEFWPDIQRKVIHKKKRGLELPTDATPIPPAPPK